MQYNILPFPPYIVYITVHTYITSGNNHLLAGVSWFALFYFAKIKLVSKSEEKSRENDVLPKFRENKKQSQVSMTSIVTSSNESEKKIAKPNTVS